MHIPVIVMLMIIIILVIGLICIDIFVSFGKSEKENTTHEKNKSHLHHRSGK